VEGCLVGLGDIDRAIRRNLQTDSDVSDFEISDITFGVEDVQEVDR
jgi:hypothetical protein